MIWLILLLALLAPTAWAENRILAEGRLPLTVTAPGLTETEMLVVRGMVSGHAATTLVLRLDDGPGLPYARRVNIERPVLPGPFDISLPLTGLRRANGEGMSAAAADRLILFAEDTSITAEIRLESGLRLPAGVQAYDLGPADGVLFPGFQPLGPDHPAIQAGKAAAIRRPGPDGLIGDGVVGATLYHFAVAPGRWRVSVWIEDPGEWETLPHPLQRRVRVNGLDLLDRRESPEAWLQRRYFPAGRQEDALTSAWAAFGQRRGERLNGEIDAADGLIRLELAGEGAPATYLAAIVLQPAEADISAADLVDQERARQFDQAWPIRPAPALDAPSAPLLLAGNGAGRLTLTLPPGAIPQHLQLDDRVEGWGWEARWSLERVSTGGQLLQPVAHHLVPFGQIQRRLPDQPRRVELWLRPRPGAAPGPFTGLVALADGRSIPLRGDILPVTLPPAPLAAGVYLDDAPHLTWFTPELTAKQNLCDLRILARLGLSAVAPPLPLPVPDQAQTYQTLLNQLESLGFRPPYLAYTPLKRLIDAHWYDDGAVQFANFATQLGPAAFAKLAWSIADEPDNAVHGMDLSPLAHRLRPVLPTLHTAAQFNSPADLGRLAGVDLALINPGLRLRRGMIATLSDQGLQPWLYNTGHPRLAAGLWGSLSGARGYLQWHARMPTADPFDPTDGREGDVQFLPPTTEICPSQPDLHADLLDLAEGIEDGRWLAWAQRHAPIQAFQLNQLLPDDWETAARLTAADLAALRRPLMELARALKP